MMRSILGWLRWRGRVRRTTFFWMLLASAAVFTVLFVFIDSSVGSAATLVLYPPAFAIWFSIGVRRLHDQARRGWWLLAVLVPILGPLLIAFLLLFKAGTPGENQFGEDPRTRGRDYLKVQIHAPF
jgi:uncharacterized membrane protein YhaH (DUF805 family)